MTKFLINPFATYVVLVVVILIARHQIPTFVLIVNFILMSFSINYYYVGTLDIKTKRWTPVNMTPIKTPRVLKQGDKHIRLFLLCFPTKVDGKWRIFKFIYLYCEYQEWASAYRARYAVTKKDKIRLEAWTRFLIKIGKETKC